MRETKLTVKPTTQFRKDYKLAMKRGLRISLLEDIVSLLALGEPLPDKNKDHALSGDWVGHGMPHPARLAAGIPSGRKCSGIDPGPHRDHMLICLDNRNAPPPYGKILPVRPVFPCPRHFRSLGADPV